MIVFRWLPAVAVAAALASCLSMPDADAQAWLRWSKASVQQHDPAKRISAPSHPTAAMTATATSVPRRGPSITISEAPPGIPTVAAPAAGAVDAMAAATDTSPLADTTAPALSPASPAIAVPTRDEPPVLRAEPLAIATNANAAAAAPADITTCNDCPTQDELKATPGGAASSDAGAQQDRPIQSEIKRRLLQGH
ncbi:hypothetical protein [Luteimonas cucumeris]|nr:hypothetical protein [Luteimonas cucumeris]